MRRLDFVAILLGMSCLALPAEVPAAEAVLTIDAPMSPPLWALLERELLRTNADACEEFFERYFDERGFLECVTRWGGNDGPDDAIENLMDWTILYSLGAPDSINRMYRKAWEGHLRQYTAARTVDVPFARDGMYYKEFSVKMDWFHNGEGLCAFNVEGLADPEYEPFRKRVRRYAGFYMNEDPGALNYDPKNRIIRSLFNGSRGPLMRRATALDWTGDPIEVENRFDAIHGERNYEEMLGHFKDYNDIVGDHPLNLVATTLGLNAYMLTHEEKYRRWVLDYVDAWKERMAANGGIIPSKVGLDGRVGGPVDGKTPTSWYDGVYGWSFTVVVPQTGALAHRNHHNRGFVGFMNAVLLTGDQGYVDLWRKQRETINKQVKTIDGRPMYPHMYGKDGWYDYTPEKYNHNALQIYFLSMQRDDREHLQGHAWLEFLEGKNPQYPEQALRKDLDRVRQKVAGMRQDRTTPDTRLADDPMRYTPASLDSLMELMVAGLPPGNVGTVLHSRLRYFDPERRRPGLPEQVAALVDRLTADEVGVTVVNLSQADEKTVMIQAGSYAEHQFVDAEIDKNTLPVDASHVAVRLAPGAGGRIKFKVKRYANSPTLALPWRYNDRAAASASPKRANGGVTTRTSAALEVSASAASFPPDDGALPGLREALDPRVAEAGESIAIESPPSDLRDADKTGNFAESVEKLFAERRSLPEGAYQLARKNWLLEQRPAGDITTLSRQIQDRYDRLIADRIMVPRLTSIDAVPLTLIYPPGYDNNASATKVRARRLTLNGVDAQGKARRLVAYYVNYDRVDPDHPTVVFQINGHFGQFPSQLGLGMRERGGYAGGALGKLAISGLPMLTYDDHDVGESSPASGTENGLYRTLANLALIDQALLDRFQRVDGIGLSGGCERLFHFLAMHRCPLRSAYLAGYFNSPWTRLDTRQRTGGPFGSDPDTDNETFNAHFQWADLALIGISRQIDVAFAHQTYESGGGKNCFVRELLPALRNFTTRFQLRGDDPDCDGVSNTGRNLAHEYDLVDYADFLSASRAAGKSARAIGR